MGCLVILGFIAFLILSLVLQSNVLMLVNFYGIETSSFLAIFIYWIAEIALIIFIIFPLVKNAAKKENTVYTDDEQANEKPAQQWSISKIVKLSILFIFSGVVLLPLFFITVFNWINVSFTFSNIILLSWILDTIIFGACFICKVIIKRL